MATLKVVVDGIKKFFTAKVPVQPGPGAGAVPGGTRHSGEAGGVV